MATLVQKEEKEKRESQTEVTVGQSLLILFLF
jgi:hypothetical protein